MPNIHLLFIIACFSIMAIFWIATAFQNKKTQKNSGGWAMRIIFYACLLLLFYLHRSETFLSNTLLPEVPAKNTLADILAFGGLIAMLWARTTLGKNWSANIVIKERHSLITTGPYQYVRHPIYAGLVLLISGLVLYANSIIAYIFLVIFFFGACYKAKKEEALLEAHFQDQYREYKKRSRLIIPFLF